MRGSQERHSPYTPETQAAQDRVAEGRAAQKFMRDQGLDIELDTSPRTKSERREFFKRQNEEFKQALQEMIQSAGEQPSDAFDRALQKAERIYTKTAQVAAEWGESVDTAIEPSMVQILQEYASRRGGQYEKDVDALIRNKPN